MLSECPYERKDEGIDNVNGKWALVTGASSGFGIEFATLLAERNANLILAARRTAPMEELAEQLRQRHRVNVVVEGIDLSVPGAGAELKTRLDKQGIAVDVLVNNAGFGLFGEFVSQPIQNTLAMLQLNILALTELTHLIAADMVKRRTGHILLVASSLGYEATPGYAAYGASKGYVLLFGEALHAELKPHGVNVTVLSPGPTATSFAHVAGQKDTIVFRMLMMEPKPVARTGILAMLRRRSSVIAGILNKVIIFSFRFTPRPMQGRIMQRALSG
jgi:short-subunit dehydrogenase